MSGKRNATAKPPGRFLVLYDGWPLVYASGSPAAIHLLEILSALPKGVEPWVALPSIDKPERTQQQLDSIACIFEDGDGVESKAEDPAAPEAAVFPLHRPMPDTPGGRLRWQQWALPSLARQIGARLVHTTGMCPPLFSGVPVIVSLTAPVEAAPVADTLAGRLGDAFGRGGLSGAQAVLWPVDLPEPPGSSSLRRMPPFAHHAFYDLQPRPGDLPESYVVAAGLLDAQALNLLSDTWAWTQDGLGEDWTLIASDLDENGLTRLRRLCQEAGITSRIERWPAAFPAQRAALFQHAAAVLALGPVLPWGDSLLQSLACGRPLVAEESPQSDTRTGPAAYLSPGGDARALGAALITVIVEETVAEQMSQAARRQLPASNAGAFSRELAAVYGIKNEGGLP